jgi:hypothetical protein
MTMPDSVAAGRLGDFLGVLRGELDWVVEHRRGLIDEELTELLTQAWTEQRWRIDEARAQIVNADQDVLAAIGMTGFSLEWKLTGFQTAWRRLDDARKQVGGAVGLLKAPFRKMLGWADVLMGSLASAFPVLEPIKEIKEGVEQSVTD